MQVTSLVLWFLLKDQFHKMVELTMAARQAYRTMLENTRQELPGELGPCAPASPPSQSPSCPVEDSPLAPTEKDQPFAQQQACGICSKPDERCWSSLKSKRLKLGF